MNNQDSGVQLRGLIVMRRGWSSDKLLVFLPLCYTIVRMRAFVSGAGAGTLEAYTLWNPSSFG